MSDSSFILLTLPNAVLTSPNGITQQGSLAIDCVTISNTDHLYLVLIVGSVECPIDPSCTISVSVQPRSRTYTTEEKGFILSVDTSAHWQDQEDLESFESILAQYATLCGDVLQNSQLLGPVLDPNLHGHLVLVDQTNGELVGEFDHRFKVEEDKQLGEKGHENDPVVIEVSGCEDSSQPLVAFAKAIPSGQHDWITSSAMVISQGISASTNILVTVIAATSSYYTSHSKTSTPATGSPSRVATLLASQTTRTGLKNMHSLSGQAVRLSAATLRIIDDMIHSAVSKKGSASRSKTTPTPSWQQRVLLAPNEKPPLPPRRSPSPQPTAVSTHNEKFSKKTRLLLSADLILSTLEQSGKTLLEVGSEHVGAAVTHRYGEHAGTNSMLLMGSARNLGVVYIDLRGFGRKTLIKKVVKVIAKERVM